MSWRQHFIALVFLLLYFWYMTGSFQTSAQQREPTSPLDTTEPDNSYRFHQTKNGIACTFNHHTWHTSIPDGYVFRPWELRRPDPCSTVNDHGKVLATGRVLYEYLKNKSLLLLPQTQQNTAFEIDASTAFQDRRVFYFECMNHEIFQLHQCPPHHVFRNKDCLPVSVCLDQPNGNRFPDPSSRLSYFECIDSKLVRKQCSSDTIFEYDRCKDADVQYFCHHNAYQLLNRNTLLVCHNGRATFETCPPGLFYFPHQSLNEKPVCEWDWCSGASDGEKRPLPVKIENGLTYTPGYAVCRRERVETIVHCPWEWDAYLADVRLPTTPTVFEPSLQDCTIPKFCENVRPRNSSTNMVPANKWGKIAPQWKYSTLADEVTGCACDSSNRAPNFIALPPGKKIGPRMTVVDACTSQTNLKVPISDDVGKYYDCALQRVVACSHPNEFFDGEKCKARDPAAFSEHGIDLFKVSNDTLDKDLWIKAWDYFPDIDKSVVKSLCTSPYVYNWTYNICSHPDCQLYPFLSQIDFSIGLRDGSTCRFDDASGGIINQRRLIEKRPPENDLKYAYWSQQPTHDEENRQEECREGDNIRSGNLFFDRTIYATCREDQPFVFCPSPKTRGIEFVDGLFTCQFDDSLMTTTMQPRETRKFFRYELFQLTSNTTTTVNINRALVTVNANVPFDMTPYNDNSQPYETTIVTTDSIITLHYQYRVSHPPHGVRLKNGGFKKYKKNYAFLMKYKAATEKSLNFPRYTFTALLPVFEPPPGTTP